MTLFNTIIGAVSLDTAEGCGLAVEAITATGAKSADHRTLCDIILGVASDAAYQHLEDLMAISYRSKFVDGWIEQGEARGREEGKAEGMAEGEALARADAILRVLKSRGLRPARGQRELIEACRDLTVLDTWFDRSLIATMVSEVFEG